MRSGLIGLVAATSAWAQYAASDDGQIVYFSSSPLSINGQGAGVRLWTWSEGKVRTAIDPTVEPTASLESLSIDGQSVLVRLAQDRWQLLRHGSATPVARIATASAAAMSRNGRWLAIAATTPRGSITRFEILPSGTRAAGVLENSDVSGLGPILTFDDGTVTLPCKLNAHCAWDGTTLTDLPAAVGNGHSARYLYYWTNPGWNAPGSQKLQQFDRISQVSVDLAVECAKRSQNYYAPSGRLAMTFYNPETSIPSSDMSGRRVRFSCAGSSFLIDTLTATQRPLPFDAVLDSTFTRILSRPSPNAFAWATLGTAVPSFAGTDSIVLTGPESPLGILTTRGEPDFTINWGGQTLPWLAGAQGYSYAVLPADLVPGASDAVSISSDNRPWLNANMQQTVRPTSPAVLPLIAADPTIAFIHGDYRGFVTPLSRPRRGDYLHFLISGVDPAQVTAPNSLQISYNDPAPGLRPPVSFSLPLIALSPTLYHRNISQVTFRIPDDAPAIRAQGGIVNCRFTIVSSDGSPVSVNAFGYLDYSSPLPLGPPIP